MSVLPEAFFVRRDSSQKRAKDATFSNHILEKLRFDLKQKAFFLCLELLKQKRNRFFGLMTQYHKMYSYLRHPLQFQLLFDLELMQQIIQFRQLLRFQRIHHGFFLHSRQLLRLRR